METALVNWTDNRLDERFAQIDARFDRLEARIDTGFADLERRFEARMDERFARVDERFSALEAKLEVKFQAIDDRSAGLVARIDRVEQRLDRLVFGQFVIFGSVLAAIISGQF